MGRDAAAKYPTATFPVPRTAETIVQLTSNVIAQGGVAFPFRTFASLDRTREGKFTFTASRPSDAWFTLKAGT